MYSADRVSVSLADLDDQLRASAAGLGVADVAAELRGELVNRPAARSARPAEKNPRVVEAAMDAACQQSLVCTSGNPTTTGAGTS